MKCCGVTHKIFNSIKGSNNQWNCKVCEETVLNANNLLNTPIKGCKKAKCGSCRKNIPGHLQNIKCDSCQKYFHVKCSATSKKIFFDLKARNESWDCTKCLSKILPFSQIDNEELFLELENKSNLINATPSFTFQSLLDQMPGQNFETDEFMSESISSKYFTPSEFLGSKLSPNKFSLVHINIASLSKHIDELRNLLCALEHPFDIIGITETRLHEKDPLVNIEIEGYEFIHTPTETQCGGAGIYIKSCYEFEIIKSISNSLPDIAESLIRDFIFIYFFTFLFFLLYSHRIEIKYID